MESENRPERKSPGMKDLSDVPGYDPSRIEEGWQAWWESNSYFRPRGTGRKFTIVLPPPNVTGRLHIGHSMMLSLQDAIVRYRRMLQCDTLYIPGTDHAGIATQAVLEKRFGKDESRDKFLEKAWTWQREYEAEILGQMRRLGASCDFSQTRFTLDPGFSRAVNEAFVRFYEKGLVKRSYRVVNWCSKIKSTLSDLEVESMEVKPFSRVRVDGGSYVFGVLYYLKYPVIRRRDFVGMFGEPRKAQLYDGPEEFMNYLELLGPRREDFGARMWEGFEFIEVATTRPETMLGDTALCVHEAFTMCRADGVPEESYLAVNPLNFNVIPVVRSGMADAGLGTGCLKITPAHDADDFELQQREGLKILRVIDEDNCVDMEGMSYWLRKLPPGKDGVCKATKMKRFDCRKAVIEVLRSTGLLTKEEGHAMTLPVCSRTGDVVEPVLRSQWWLDCRRMAERSLEATRSRRIKIFPEEAGRTWENWLRNIRDWCLSRQLWWGHRVPAYRVFSTANGREKKLGWVVGRTRDEAEQRAHAEHGGCTRLEQDEDVLDTWFSSALWPFAVLGWPGELDRSRFPTSLLETGSDILFFWVARMVMCSLELCDEVPFEKVLLHGIVRDSHGKKMSKSVGNVVDPLFVICGASLDTLGESLPPNLGDKERRAALRNQKTWFPNGIKECGADALRFALCSYVHSLRDVNLDIKRVEGYRRFCNKLWNAFVFVRRSVLETEGGDALFSSLSLSPVPGEILSWIEARCDETITALSGSLDSFDFMSATQAIHSFFLYDFCDVFIEVAKKRRSTFLVARMVKIFVTIVKMLHPFMPFVTEEIYQRLKADVSRASRGWPGAESLEWDASIAISRWPLPSGCGDLGFEKVLRFARHLRSLVGKDRMKLVLGDGLYRDEIGALVRGVMEICVSDDSSLQAFEGFRFRLANA